MDTQPEDSATGGTVNEFLENYKDYTIQEMEPCLDVLFRAYSYEYEQAEIVDHLSIQEYESLLKAYKINRTMALKLKTDTVCCVCKGNLVRSMGNGEKEQITLFGCGHAAHRSCIDSNRCPVEGCWNDIEQEASLSRRRSTSSQIRSPVVAWRGFYNRKRRLKRS